MNWVNSVNKDMRRKGRNILLFIDNAPSHGHGLSLSNIALKFVPPNTTSHLQEITRTCNALYRKNLLRSLIAEYHRFCRHCSGTTCMQADHAVKEHWLDFSSAEAWLGYYGCKAFSDSCIQRFCVASFKFLWWWGWWWHCAFGCPLSPILSDNRRSPSYWWWSGDRICLW